MFRVLRICVTVLFAFAVACSGGGSPAPSPSIFEVTQVAPDDNDSGVAVREDIRIVFSRPVDETSLDAESIKVVTASGKVIHGTRSVSKLTPTTVSFVPVFQFDSATLHRVMISTAVRDDSGQALARAHESRFTTQDPPPPMPGQALVDDLGNVLSGGRWFHQATLLTTGDILVAGGYIATSTTQSLVELIDPVTGQSTVQAAALVQPRARHVQVLLDDGRVLLAGGEIDDVSFSPLLAAETWNPQSHTTTAVAPMHFRRSAATATKLPDGRVLVSGGMSLDGTTFIFRDDAEIYDPVADTWTVVSSVMNRGRAGHGSWNLSNGDVLVVGGTSAEPSAQRLDGVTGLFESTTTLPVKAHIFGVAATLGDGRPIYFGGSGTRAITIFDETFGFLSTLNTMLSERVFATAHTLADGRILVVGGTDFSNSPALLHTTIDLFAPEDLTGRMWRIPNLTLPVPTSHHAAVLDSAGDLWIIGGLPTAASGSGLRRVTALRLSQE